MTSLPRVALLATGGTIASAAASREATSGYALHGGGVDALLDAVPELEGVARLLPEQVSDLASPNMTLAAMLQLAKRVAALLARGDVDGAVVTHGTDTLEETAYLLHLVVRTRKPIVLTGAMRPASALSADGPMNLLQAVRVAACPRAAGRGAMIVMNDRILSARLASKTDATAPDAFRGNELGRLVAGQPVFTAWPEGRHTLESGFDALAIDALPAVDVLHCYADMPPALFDAVIAGRPAGLVMACTGNGSLPHAVRPMVEQVVAAGIRVVRASRTGGGATSWRGLPGLPAGMLNPQKARLLLSLALTVTADPPELDRIFQEY